MLLEARQGLRLAGYDEYGASGYLVLARVQDGREEAAGFWKAAGQTGGQIEGSLSQVIGRSRVRTVRHEEHDDA